MPKGNRMGPDNQGPMTGRRMGLCAGFDVPGYVNQGIDQGRGRGFGRMTAVNPRGLFRPRFLGCRVMQPIYEEPIKTQEKPELEEKQILEQEVKILELELKGLRERIKSLE